MKSYPNKTYTNNKKPTWSSQNEHSYKQTFTEEFFVERPTQEFTKKEKVLAARPREEIMEQLKNQQRIPKICIIALNGGDLNFYASPPFSVIAAVSVQNPERGRLGICVIGLNAQIYLPNIDYLSKNFFHMNTQYLMQRYKQVG